MDYCLAQIVLHSAVWTKTYIIARELGAGSIFGESCLTELQEIQLNLLTLTQLYDVVSTAVSRETKIPERVKPYPGKVLSWYERWKCERRDKSSQGGNPSGGGKTVKFYSEE